MKKIMKYVTTTLLLIILMVLFSCGKQNIDERFIPKVESQFAEDYLQKIRNKDFEYVKGQLTLEYQKQVTDELLNEVSSLFPKGELISTEIIGSHQHTFNSKWQGNFTFEYQFSDGWAAANVVLIRVNNELKVIGFHVYRTQASQKELNAFTAANLSLAHIVILVFTFGIPLFMIFTCFQVYKTPIPKRKWLWYIVSFIGIGGVTFNWTTGVFTYQLLTIKFLGFSAVATSVHAPWLFTLTIPIGPIVFWLKRKKYIEQSKNNHSDLSTHTTEPD